MFKTIRFLFSLLLVGAFSVAVATVTGSPIAGWGCVGASLFVKAPANSLLMAVVPEIWTDYIIENLWKNNEFLLNSVDESQYVVGGSLVHIPQAGAPSKVQRNRSVLPAQITRRIDVDITYALDELTTDPRRISHADAVELSYNKMESCMSEDMSALHELTAESMLFNWRPKYYISTTGAATDAIYGTGTRKKVTIADFSNAKKIFNKWNIPKADRFVILSTEMLDELTVEIKASQNTNLSVVYDAATGDISKFEGFKIFERSTALLSFEVSLTTVPNTAYKTWTGGTDKIYSPEDFQDIEVGDESANADAAMVALFWHKNAVARAVGGTEMFDRNRDPEYYGDIYSFLQRLGGRARRDDGKGVLGLMQAIA